MNLRKIEVWGMKLEVLMAWKMRIFLLVAAASLYLNQEYRFAAYGLMAFSVSLAPVYIKRSWHANLPPIIDFSFVLFLAAYASLLIFSKLNAISTPHYDKFVHAIGGGFIGVIAFSILFILMYHTSKLKIDYRLWFIFVVSFAVTIGVAVELGEVILYKSWTDQQLNTILDLSADALGGFVVALIGVEWLKRTPLSEKKRDFNIPKLTRIVKKEV